MFIPEGTNADCGGFQCCRADSGPPTDPANAAGYWGALGTCDIPVVQFICYFFPNIIRELSNNLSSLSVQTLMFQ